MNESYADPVFPCINDAGLHRIIRAGASLVPKLRPPMLTVWLFVLEWMGGGGALPSVVGGLVSRPYISEQSNAGTNGSGLAL